MIRLITAISFIIACFPVTSPLAATPISLAKNGQVDAVIVLAQDASLAEQTAAQELALYLGRVTGGEFKIILEEEIPTESTAIFVGPTEVAQQHGLVPEGPEAWRIATIDEGLVITGGRPRGTLYGVYHFLEDVVGVHWWSRHEEHVPSRPALEVEQMDASGEPAFRYRDTFDGFPHILPNEFYARNRMNGHSTRVPAAYGGTYGYGLPSNSHTFHDYLSPDQYFNEHPEYFSLIDGKRVRDAQPNLTNPDVQKIFSTKLREYIARSRTQADAENSPYPVMYELSLNDSQRFDQGPQAQKLIERHGKSGYLLWFLNKLADDIRDEHPEVILSTLAYGATYDSPQEIRPSDNVAIRLALMGMDKNVPITHPHNDESRQMLNTWAEMTEHLGIWEYSPTFHQLHEGLPMVNVLTLDDTYRYFRKAGVEGVFTESEYPILQHLFDMKTWIRAKLLEDPAQDADVLIETFTDGFYGPAGTHVRTYLNELQRASHRIRRERSAFPIHHEADATEYGYLDLSTVNRLHDIFDAAETEVTNDPILLRRIRHARLSLDRATLYRWTLLTDEWKAQRPGSPMSLDRQRIGQRAIDTIREQIALRIPEDYDGWQRSKPADQVVALEQVLQIKDDVPLPDTLAGLPIERVLDFNPTQFSLHYASEVVVDEESPFGIAAQIRLQKGHGVYTDRDRPDNQQDALRLTHSNPFTIGLWSGGDRTLLAITPSDIPGPGYHLYKVENVELPSAGVLWASPLHAFQVELEPWLERLGYPERADIYVSIKFTGAAYPHGQADEDDTISINRVIVVAKE